MAKASQPDPWAPPARILTAEGRKEWQRLIAELRCRGALDTLSREAAARYCVAWQQFVALSAEAAKPRLPLAQQQALMQDVARASRMLSSARSDLGLPRASIRPPAPAADDAHLARPPADFFRMTAPATGKGKRH